MSQSRRLEDGTWNGLLLAALALSHHLEAEMDRALAIVPLSARSFVALYEIAKEPAATQRDLAGRLELDQSTTSELLGRLERRRWVTRDPARRGGRRPRPADRCVAIRLTEAGRAVVEQAEAIATILEDEWAQRLARAAASSSPTMRAQGLRRWLSESRAALAAQPSGTSSKPAVAK